MHYTLITGSSNGIGRALALECAGRGMNILLVALPGIELTDLATHIRNTFKVECETLGINLSKQDAVKEVYDWVKSNKYNVNVLINNVGLGSKGAFEKTSPEFYAMQIQLNVTTTCMLTRLFIDDLKNNAPSYILNTGSLGGFFAMPYKSVYAASKAFVYTFSLSLALELKDAGINVSVLCPGGTDTNANVKASNADLKGLARKSILQPEQVAKEAITQMLKGRMRIIPGGINKISYYMGRMIPGFVKNHLVKRAFKNISRHSY